MSWQMGHRNWQCGYDSKRLYTMKNLDNKCVFWLLSMYWFFSRREELHNFRLYYRQKRSPEIMFAFLLAWHSAKYVYYFILHIWCVCVCVCFPVLLPDFLYELFGPLKAICEVFYQKDQSDEFLLWSSEPSFAP